MQRNEHYMIKKIIAERCIVCETIIGDFSFGEIGLLVSGHFSATVLH